MTAVVGYGSLVNPREVRRTLGAYDHRLTPVRVEGYRRLFDQETVWRPTEGDERAVLNVRPDEASWINAVCISGLEDAAVRNLEEREAGYDSRRVSPGDVIPYDADEAGLEGTEFAGVYEASVDESELVISVGNRVRDDIQPIPEYVELCIEGASSWGEVFYREFAETTDWGSVDPDSFG